MNWDKKQTKGPQWPENEDGEPVPPAFLKRIYGGPLDIELTLNLLEAYGIPHVGELPNNGSFGKLIMGHAPGGMEVYVPETMLEDAINILSTDEFSDDADDADDAGHRALGESNEYEENGEYGEPDANDEE